MTTELRTIVKKEPAGSEIFKKTPEEKLALKKAKAEHKKLNPKNGRKA